MADGIHYAFIAEEMQRCRDAGGVDDWFSTLCLANPLLGARSRCCCVHDDFSRIVMSLALLCLPRVPIVAAFVITCGTRMAVKVKVKMITWK